MPRGIWAFVFVPMLMTFSVLLAPLGCHETGGEKAEPRLYVQLNGQKEHYGLRPAFYIVSGGGAYGLGISETRVLDGVEYRGRWLYSGKLKDDLIKDDLKPENLLMGVYGRAEPGTDRLAELVIETNVNTKIVLLNCEAWEVRLRRSNQVITDQHWFEPGKYEVEIKPQE